MVKFCDVTDEVKKVELGVGRHLVKTVKSTNKTQEGEVMYDYDGNETWGVNFENNEGYYREFFTFSGVKAHKTGNFFRAIGILAEDEKLSECKRDFQPEEVEDKYLWITIEATDKVKKGKWITFDGFEKYEGKTKAKPKKEEVEEDTLPF